MAEDSVRGLLRAAGIKRILDGERGLRCLLAAKRDTEGIENGIEIRLRQFLSGLGIQLVLVELEAGQDSVKGLEDLVPDSILGVLAPRSWAPEAIYQLGYLKGMGKFVIAVTGGGEAPEFDGDGFVNARLPGHIEIICLPEGSGAEAVSGLIGEKIRESLGVVLYRHTSGQPGGPDEICRLLALYTAGGGFGPDELEELYGLIYGPGGTPDPDLILQLAFLYSRLAETLPGGEAAGLSHSRRVSIYEGLISRRPGGRREGVAKKKLADLVLDECGDDDRAETLRKAAALYREALALLVPGLDEYERASAGNNLGLALCRLGEIERSPQSLRESADILAEASGSRALGRLPRERAIIKFNLGCACLSLAEYDAPDENYENAALHFEEAIHDALGSGDASLRAACLLGLGELSSRLAVSRSSAEYCGRAAGYFLDALEFYRADAHPYLFHAINERAGSAYVLLSGLSGDRIGPLNNAVRHYDDASGSGAESGFPDIYTRARLGSARAYALLSDEADKIGNLESAASACEEGLAIGGGDSSRLFYGQVLSGLGDALFSSPGAAMDGHATRRAIGAYEKAAEIYGKESCPEDYARVFSSLARAYDRLARLEESAEGCTKAVAAYRAALDVYALSEHPLEYAAHMSGIGDAYSTLAEIEDRAGNLKMAAEAYEESLIAASPDNAPELYVKTAASLGAVCGALAEAGEDVLFNLGRAADAYREALRVYTIHKSPLEYAAAGRNLGDAYAAIAALEPSAGSLRGAVSAYEDVLKIYTHEDYPLLHTAIKKELGRLYADLASIEDEAVNLGLALGSLDDASLACGREKSPAEYARLKSEIGALYMRLARADGNTENYKRAADAFEDALADAPDGAEAAIRMQAAIRLGDACACIAEGEEGIAYRMKAIGSYEEALGLFGADERTGADDVRRKLFSLYEGLDTGLSGSPAGAAEILNRALEIYDKESFPLEHFALRKKLGGVYLKSAREGGHESHENYVSAARELSAAREIILDEEYTSERGRLSLELGDIYAGIADKTGDIADRRKSAEFYEDALGCFIHEDDTTLPGEIYRKLGLALIGSAGGADRDHYISRGLGCLEKALELRSAPGFEEERSGLVTVIASHCASLGDAHMEEGDFEGALGAYTRGLGTAGVQTEPREWAALKAGAGRAHAGLASSQNSHTHAIYGIESCKDALTVYNEYGYPAENLKSQEAVNALYAFLGGYEAAPEKAVSSYTDISDTCAGGVCPEVFARTMVKLGRAYAGLSRAGDKGYHSEKAIDAYFNSLAYYDIEDHRQEYGEINRIITGIYLELGSHERQASYFHDSVRCLTEAIKVYTAVESPGTHGELMCVLGETCITLYEIEGGESHLRRAAEAFRASIECVQTEPNDGKVKAVMKRLSGVYQLLEASLEGGHENAIEFYGEYVSLLDPDEDRMLRASALVRLGDACSDLSASGGGRGGYERAADAYVEALSYYDADVHPEEYRSVSVKAGSVYKTQGDMEAASGDPRKAAAYYGEAFLFYPQEVAETEYLSAGRNIGLSFKRLFETSGDPDDCRSAITALSEVLHSLESSGEEPEFRDTALVLAGLYESLAEYEEKAGRRDEVVLCMSGLLGLYGQSEYPEEYAGAHFTAAGFYARLAEAGETAVNTELAIDSYREAAAFYTPERSPERHGEISSLVAGLYRSLARLETTGVDMRIGYYKEALAYSQNEPASSMSAGMLEELGAAYTAAAQAEDRTLNLSKAAECYESAAAFYGAGEYPQDCGRLGDALGTVCAGIAGETGDEAFLVRAEEAFKSALASYDIERFPAEHGAVAEKLASLRAASAGEPDETPAGDAEEDSAEDIERPLLTIVPPEEEPGGHTGGNGFDHTHGEVSIHLIRDSEPDGPEDETQHSGEGDSKVSSEDPRNDSFSVKYAEGLAYMESAQSGGRPGDLRKAVRSFEEAIKLGSAETSPEDYAALYRALADSLAAMAADRVDKKLYARALDAYAKALKTYTGEAHPAEYGDINYRTGLIYATLGEIEGDPARYKEALRDYGEALSAADPERALADYGSIEKNIGLTLGILAEVEGRPELYEAAVEAFTQALRAYDVNGHPAEYALIRKYMGIAYGNIAGRNGDPDSYVRAVRAYREALVFYTFDSAPADYGLIQRNIAAAHEGLSSVSDKISNSSSAALAYEEALKCYTREKSPDEHASILGSLGGIYQLLAGAGDTAANCRKAVKCYEKVLKVYTLKEHPPEYAAAQNNLGIVYRTLAEAEDKGRNCKRALNAYMEALRVYSEKEHPVQYGSTKNNIGTAYMTLADVEDKESNCRMALKAFEEALKVRTIQSHPMQFAATQNNLGVVYRMLSEVEDRARNCKKAINAYETALIVYSAERFPIEYATARNNIGGAYTTLAEEEDRTKNCDKAARAYQEALTVFTRDKFPGPHEIVRTNLERLFELYGKDLAVN